MNRHNDEMYRLYEDYKETLRISKKACNSRQKTNREIRETYDEPYKRADYNKNKSDITCWNEMIGELESDIKSIEMYLEYDDRVFLHKDYDNMKAMIYNPSSYEGEIPLESVYGVSIPDTTDIICDVELQEEIVELLDKILTERQRDVIKMYFWDGMTQEKIGNKLGLTQRGVGKILENSLEILRNCINYDEIIGILQK